MHGFKIPQKLWLGIMIPRSIGSVCISPEAIQTQMGHTNTASFQVYIKSLSLLENKEFAQKTPDLPGF